MQHRAVVLTTHSMEEAEALCTRIGIMVKGQLQALGTPQHLKTKFGSGYELILKLKPQLPTAAGGAADQGAHEAARVGKVRAFIEGLYPDATLVSENGGLLTFMVPNHSIKVGPAFEALEGEREALEVSDYAVAQPTLEQVFVRTVMEHSGGERANTLPPTSEGAAQGAAQGAARGGKEGEEGGGEAAGEFRVARQESVPLESDVATGVAKAWLGLDRRAHRWLGISSGLFMFLCYFTIFSDDVGFVVFNFFVAWIFCMIGCIGCCCIIPSDPDENDDD